ncbi:MAG: hypothetical protein CMH63_00750 [Nanoarchaeota archaeon]|jgi:sugar-specific transcriptional regulator TrmB|nr:hypothetical protein [Nanoarchaeota archaeon]|tara:strand:+ start:12209 stop:12955 length:747 start_codon:yes stop_codon:yes gene_type:complete
MEQLLERIGLTPSESKVYLTLLELGEAKVSQILQKSELNSGRIYDVLNSLENKGLVSEITKKKIKLFIPSPPERILDYLNKKENQIEKDKKEITKIMPHLSEKFKQIKQKTNVEVFLGTNGMKTAYSLLFKETERDKELYVYGIVEKKEYKKDILDMLQYYVYKQRRDLKLRTKKLISKEARGEKLYAQDNSFIKYLPYPSITGIEVLGEMTLIQFLQDPVIMILIKNSTIAKDYKTMFKFLWKIAKK